LKKDINFNAKYIDVEGFCIKFATDTTPHPRSRLPRGESLWRALRPYAKTLAEHGYIYQLYSIKGNKPINIGHSYSILSMLPEKETGNTCQPEYPQELRR
jgi:hypothetical protein